MDQEAPKRNPHGLVGERALRKGDQRRMPAQALGVATALDADANESPWAAATPGDRESWKGREKQPEGPEAVSALSKAWPARWARTTSKSQPGSPPRVRGPNPASP